VPLACPLWLAKPFITSLLDRAGNMAYGFS